MLTSAGIWPECQLETQPFCWARQAGVVGRQHAIGICFSIDTAVSNQAVDFYVFIWSVRTVVLCRVV
jgi:hypothetical protein